ncbi:MAG: IS1634 family transposase [Bacilli bacterium]|nr:IS1634 family transposase [Bacilli bacterium]
MRVNIVKSKHSTLFYIIESFRHNGKSTTRIIEKLGTLEEVIKKASGQDPYEWANQQAALLTEAKLKDQRDIHLTLSNHKLIDEGSLRSLNAGYLFLKKIYYELHLDELCQRLSEKDKFEYDLNAILSTLLYTRILYPSSKRSSFEASQKLMEHPAIELHQIYRALDVLAKHNDVIQTHLYQYSQSIVERNTQILYYDCTNFFFEIELAEGFKQYGKSKEHRPNPIVQMGLFLDGHGIPLAFDLTPGNTNEQKTLLPLEKRIIHDFELSKLVVCTDAGLSSKDNRRFNSFTHRAYVTVQPLKKLKQHLKDWALDPSGWQLKGSSKSFNLNDIDLEDTSAIYTKERWIHENGLEERLIISFSIKYKRYQETIRERQIERATKQIETKSFSKGNKNPNDPARFIQELKTTSSGEVASQRHLSLDIDKIESERQYDGFYGVVTNLEDDVESIIKINQRRWEIEESFRIMKSEFKARPVYLKNEERIQAHFLTCFMALTLFRILEKRINESVSAESLIQTLREMDLHPIRGSGYLPLFTRTNLTDKLQKTFGYQLSTEIIDLDTMKKIKRISKQKKLLQSEHI